MDTCVYYTKVSHETDTFAYKTKVSNETDIWTLGLLK